MSRGNITNIDLRIGEFYLWDEDDATEYAFGIYHTDCNDGMFQRCSSREEALEWADRANEKLKKATRPIYNIADLFCEEEN